MRDDIIGRTQISGPKPLGEIINIAAARDRRQNTFRAMLMDTRDLLVSLHYGTPEDQLAANLQIEAINQVLTDDSKPD